MMKFFLTLIFLALSCAFHSAQANDGSFQLAQFDPRELTLDEELGLTEPEEKSATPEDRKTQLANRYYNGCIANPTPALPKSAQESLCSCAAVGMESDMTLEEVEGLFTQVPKSANYREKFLTEIYGNCLKYPMRAFILDDCMSNKKFRREVKQYKQVCECAADTTGRYFNQMGPTLMLGALQGDWSAPDPLMNVITSREFGRVSAGYLRRCVQIHVFGLK